VTVVAYGGERFQKLARKFHARFDSVAEPGEFKVFDKRARHPEWSAKGTEAVARVAQLWRSIGLPFPLEEVLEGW
jgi:hypothetical protein